MGNISSVSKSFFNFLPVFRISGTSTHVEIVSKWFCGNWGTNLQIVIFTSLHLYCSEVYVSPVDKCLKVTANFNPTSTAFLKLVIDFLRWGNPFFNQIKEIASSASMPVVISSSKSVL